MHTFRLRVDLRRQVIAYLRYQRFMPMQGTDSIVVGVLGSSDVDRSAYAAFLREHGVAAEPSPGEILQESAEAEIASQITFLVDAVKILVPGLAVNAIYDVCKTRLRPLFRQLAKAVRERRELGERHLLTVIVKFDRGTSTYNLPGVDRQAAIEAIGIRLPESINADPSERSHFWIDGYWMPSARAAEQFESLHSRVDGPCKVPDGLAGALRGRIADIYRCSVGSHVFIEFAAPSQDELDDLLDALRRALPEGAVLGLTGRRNLIHVEFA